MLRFPCPCGDLVCPSRRRCQNLRDAQGGHSALRNLREAAHASKHQAIAPPASGIAVAVRRPPRKSCRAASEGLASLQKWTRVGCSIAELMREASHMFEVVNHAISDPAPQASLASLACKPYRTAQHRAGADRCRSPRCRSGRRRSFAGRYAGARLRRDGSIDALHERLRLQCGRSRPRAARGRNRRREGRPKSIWLRCGSRTRRYAPGADDFSASCDGQSRQKFFGNVLEMLSGRSSSVEATASEPASSLALSRARRSRHRRSRSPRNRRPVFCDC
jgi:hypothetical protein